MTAALLVPWFIALTAGGVLVLRGTLRRVLRGQIDPFFAVFFASAVAYLVIAPSLVRLFSQELEGTRSFAAYAVMQFLSIGLFIVPLWLAYRSRSGTDGLKAGSLTSVVTTARTSPVIAFGIGHGLVNLYVLFTNGFLFQRLGTFGSVDAVLRFTPLETLVVGTFRDSSGLWMAVAALAFARAKQDPRHRLLPSMSLLLMLVTLAPAAINSRASALILLSIAASMSLLARTPRRSGSRRRQGRLLLLSAIGMFVVLQVALNVRTNFVAVRNDAPVELQIYSPVGDRQGVNRLDCIDFLSRLDFALTDFEGTEPFDSVSWQVRRYIDRAGFDEYRRGISPDPKQYFIRRYVSSSKSDYFSCAIVETFGGFSYAGLLVPGLFFGYMFGFGSRILANDQDRRLSFRYYLVLGVTLWSLKFDNGASTIVFGWLNMVPLVVLLGAAKPFDWRPPDREPEDGPRAPSATARAPAVAPAGHRSSP